MPRKKKATTSKEVAEAAMPQETTAITPAAEAVTLPETGSDAKRQTVTSPRHHRNKRGGSARKAKGLGRRPPHAKKSGPNRHAST